MWIFIIFIILIILGIFIFIYFKGSENTPKHDCIKANKCPASIRCKDEKSSKCFKPGLKEIKKQVIKEEKKEIFDLLILTFVIFCILLVIWRIGR